MFCSRCGTPLQADYSFCPKCGGVQTQPATAQQAAYYNQVRTDNRIRILGTLWMIFGGLWLLPSLFFVTLGRGWDIADRHWGMMGGLSGPLFLALGSSFVLVGAAAFCVGWGLRQREPWARIAALVVGVLAIFHPPFGTLLGIFTLWVLLSKDASAEYERYSRSR